MSQWKPPRPGSRVPLERRRDRVTSTLIDVAIIYRRVFSPSACRDYLTMAQVKPEIIARVLANQCRHPCTDR